MFRRKTSPGRRYAFVTHVAAFATQSFTHVAFLVHLLDTSLSCCCSVFILSFCVLFNLVGTFAVIAACGKF